MSRFLSLLCLCLLAVENVVCLNCYVTENTVNLQNVSHYQKLQNCFASDKRKTDSSNIGLSIIDEMKVMSCYKTVGSDADGNDLVVKKCSFAEGCNLIESLFKWTPGVKKDTVRCYECDSDGCNSASKFTVFGLLTVVSATIIFVF